MAPRPCDMWVGMLRREAVVRLTLFSKAHELRIARRGKILEIFSR